MPEYYLYEALDISNEAVPTLGGSSGREYPRREEGLALITQLGDEWQNRKAEGCIVHIGMCSEPSFYECSTNCGIIEDNRNFDTDFYWNGGDGYEAIILEVYRG